MTDLPTTLYNIGNDVGDPQTPPCGTPMVPGHEVSFTSMLSEYHDAGFNTWRINTNSNCVINVVFDDANLRNLDTYVNDIRDEGMHIYFQMQGFTPLFRSGFSAGDPVKMANVLLYTRQIVDRYGAYVDFWEVGNEMYEEDSPINPNPNPQPPNEYQDAWLLECVDEIQARDPYSHPISMSWEREDLAYIDITSPHRYNTQPLGMIANWWDGQVDLWKGAATKPVIFGEVGNNVCNNDADTPYRWRVVSWISFFREVSVIFWNTAGITWMPPGTAANVDMNEEFRNNMSALGDFTDGFDRDASSLGSVQASDMTIKTYALSGPVHYGLYLYAQSNPSGLSTGVTVEINSINGGQGEWIRPIDGTVISTITVPSGVPTTLLVPDFTGDIALKVTSTATVCQEDLGFGGPGNSTLSLCGGDLSSGTTAQLLLVNAAPSALCVLYGSFCDVSAPAFGGVLVPYPDFTTLGYTSDTAGSVSILFPGGVADLNYYVQFAYEDLILPGGVGLSNALRAKFLP